jgi:hypothetical protein
VIVPHVTTRASFNENFSCVAVEIKVLVSARTIDAAKRSEEILGLVQADRGPLNYLSSAGRGLLERLSVPGDDEEKQRFATAARELARDYYESCDRYDLISFPIMYSTDVAE